MILGALAQDDQASFRQGGGKNFILGFLKGSLGEEYSSVEDWITNFDALFNDIKTIIESNRSNAVDWTVLIAQIGSIIYDIIDSVKLWKQLPGKVAEVFKNWIGKLKTPRDIARVIKKMLL